MMAQTGQIEAYAAFAPDNRKAELARGGLDSAAQHVGRLKRGGRVIAMTGGQYSLMDVIEAMARKCGPGCDVVIATWTAGVRDSELAAGVKRDGWIDRLRLVVDRSFPGRQPQYVARVREVFGDDSIRMTRIHGKFALVAAGDWRVVIRTSMNLNRNQRIEYWEADDCPELYAWWLEVVEGLFDGVSAGLGAEESDIQAGFESVIGRVGGGAEDRKAPSLDAGATSARVAGLFGARHG